MIRPDEALEQLRSANPLPGIDHADAEELVISRSHFEERRLAMTTRAPKRSEVRSPARRWRPAAVAATAFTVVLVGLGVGNLVLRNSELPVGDEPAIDTTVAVTGLPTTVVTTSPPTTEVTTSEPPEDPAHAPGAGISVRMHSRMVPDPTC